MPPWPLIKLRAPIAEFEPTETPVPRLRITPVQTIIVSLPTVQLFPKFTPSEESALIYTLSSSIKFLPDEKEDLKSIVTFLPRNKIPLDFKKNNFAIKPLNTCKKRKYIIAIKFETEISFSNL